MAIDRIIQFTGTHTHIHTDEKPLKILDTSLVSSCNKPIKKRYHKMTTHPNVGVSLLNIQTDPGNIPKKKSKWKDHQLSFKKKVKPQWKIHSMSLTVKKEKKKNAFPSLTLPYSFSKKEGIWGLNIGKSNSSWKEKV